MKVRGYSTLFLLPVVFGAAISNEKKAQDSFLQKFQFLLDDYKQEISQSLGHAREVADNALRKYGEKDNVVNWPNNINELVDMFFSKAGISGAKLDFNIFGTSIKIDTKPNSNPFPVINIAVNQGPPPLSFDNSPYAAPIPGVNNVLKPSLNPPHPFETKANIVPFPVFNNGPKPSSSSLSSFDLGDYFSGIIVPTPTGRGSPSSPTSNFGLPSNLPSIINPVNTKKICNKGSLGGLLACFGEAFANIIDGFNTSYLNITPVSDFFRKAGSSLGKTVDNNINEEEVTNQIVNFITTLASGDNPIGYGLRNIGSSIFNNPAVRLVGISNLSDLIKKGNGYVIDALESFIGETSEKGRELVSQIVNNITTSLLDNIHKQTNPDSRSSIHDITFQKLQQEFSAFTEMRTSVLPNDLQKLMRMAQHVSNEGYAADASFYNVFFDPSDANIEKAVVRIAQIVTEYKE